MKDKRIPAVTEACAGSSSFFSASPTFSSDASTTGATSGSSSVHQLLII